MTSSDRPTEGAGPAPDPWPHVRVQGDHARARSEWLHTNGAGAFAGSTLACLHTRRYHGLLVAALDPPRARHVILSHVDATVLLPNEAAADARQAGEDGGPFELATHQFPGVDPTAGKLYLDRFDQDPLPRFTYAVAGGELEVRLALVRGENAVVLRYAWRGPTPILLRLRPLLAMRHFHHLTHENGGFVHRVEVRPGEVRTQPKRDLPRVFFRHEGTFVGSPDWWRRFEYLAERDRGLDFQEDLWTPGRFEMTFGTSDESGESDGPRWIVAATDRLPPGEPEALMAEAEAAALADDPGPARALLERRLSIAAGAFCADLARRPGIVAGYPWFEVWGRDTLIALPGLYLVRGRLPAAMRILRELIGAMQDGLVPNRIPDAGQAAEFHAADATLWLFEAARLVADALGDRHPFVLEELLLALRDAFEAALAGTRNAIHVTDDGLFAAGHPGDSLTWMDARVDGRAVTPRVGCPVELTALWAKGCETLARLARAAGDPALRERAIEASRKARAAFHARFWCDATAYPYDVVSPEAEGPEAFADPSVRCNAVIALAVDPDCFTRARARLVLERARAELVTPAGLRTLSPNDPAYVGHYRGGVAERDAAYHQGTVWPWLLPFYVRAARRAAASGIAPIERVDELRALVESAAANAMALGQVPEIADGDWPHLPGGCVAQAWSVAELLRAIAWDLA